MKWEVGDVGIVVNAFYAENEGIEAVIICHRTLPCDVKTVPKGTVGFTAETHDGSRGFLTAAQLRPLPPPEEVVSWDQCVWRPKEIA